MEKLELMKWQKEAVERAKTEDSFALLCGVGTGKTCAAVQILRFRFNQHKRYMRTLILGPVAVIYNWEKEITKFSNIKPEKIYVCSGTGETRVRRLANFLQKNEEGIVITNYESLRNRKLYDLIMGFVPEIMICDESHVVKAHDSQQSKWTYNISAFAKYIYLLTGTPILNSPQDIFQQYKIMDSSIFGKNYFAFRNKYFQDDNAMLRAMGRCTFPKWVPREEMFPELTEKIHSHAIRVMSSECLDLPPLVEQTYHVELNTIQKKLYKEMKRDFITYIDDNKEKPRAIVAQLALTKALRLQEIVSGYAKTDDGKIVSLGNIPRLKETESLLLQITPTDKVIIWCSFIENYKQLGVLCEKLGIKYLFLTGNQSAKEKQENIDLFQEDDSYRVMIANRRAGGTGTTMTAAKYSITYSRNFSLGDEIQSTGRNYRRGSEIHDKIIKIKLIAKDTIDELLEEALNKKQKISDIIIDRRKEL